MLPFTRLFLDLDQSNRTSEKVAAIEQYFRHASPADAAHALYFLSGNRFKRVLKTKVMVQTALLITKTPEWLLDECYEAVGDLSETVALLLPGGETPTDTPLHTIVDRWIRPLLHAEDAAASDQLALAWSKLGRDQRFVFNKLLRGNFRVGVNRRLVQRALAAVADIDPAVMAHRLSGKVEPTEAAYLRIMSGGTSEDDFSRPYPFCLANQLNDPPQSLGDIADWQIEYKWDGIRAQILRRAAPHPDGRVTTHLWSRGDELITDQFPELALAAASLPPGTVLDGEVLAWRHTSPGAPDGRALSFNALQTRLNRKNVQPSLFDADGIVFIAFDILEHEARDIRDQPLSARRLVLEQLHRRHLASAEVIKLAPILTPRSWPDAGALRTTARTDRNAEGLMLKHRQSAYHVGRGVIRARESASADNPSPPKSAGGWWKWKIDPFSVDAVLIYAQPGSGKRAGLFTDYTFGIWDGEALTPFAKAYSGLDNDEIKRVDALIRVNTTGRMGPVRVVRPALVFEIGFETIRASPRHRSGIAVRFPRILRWREDKKPADADTLDSVRALLARHTD